MRTILLLATLFAPATYAGTTVTLLHFSDYHSHAKPFFSEGLAEQGGMARAVRYLRDEKAKGALVFNGGDMMNKGAPAWSDRYRCAEWSWLNGVVDAMAFGNHDADYGYSEYVRCAKAVKYPVLSANTSGFDAYRVFRRGGVKIGVFAIAGPGFETLVKVPELKFGDSVAAARSAVRQLREVEKVDAVVLIGHENAADDYELARAVPGIDLIFGTHSHLKQELGRIEGTSTWFISPYQYLTYVSRVELKFSGRRLSDVSGRLVRIDSSMPEDRRIARRVGAMQRALEADPAYRELFTKVGSVASAIDVAGLNDRDSALGNVVMDLVREAAGAELALSTSSSFRGGLAAGEVTLEDLRAVLPYDNEILVYELKGRDVTRLLAYAMAQRGSDSFVQLSGVRISASAPEAATVGGTGIESERTYRVATTDYLARNARGYRDFFIPLEGRPSGRRVRDELRRHLQSHSPVTPVLDGRISR